MKLKYGLICGTLMTWFLGVSPAPAQSERLRAAMTGAAGEGRCSFEVEVDGAAELEIHGDTGDLRTTSGSPARWRRLECNQPLPNNPSNFRFQSVDGRGRQQLLRDPNSSGGVAVIAIEDPQAGRAIYTGEITWRGGDNHWGGVGNWGGLAGHPEARGDNGRMDNGRIDNRGIDERDRAAQDYRNGANAWSQRISPGAAVNICRNQVMATRTIPRSRISVQAPSLAPDGDSIINFSFVNDAGRTKNGVCVVSPTGQIIQFQVEQGASAYRATLNQALNTCQEEVGRRYGIAPDGVRVQHGADPGNGSYLVNFQAQQSNGRIATGACRISPTGELETFQRW